MEDNNRADAANELDQGLLNEDLLCIVCDGMDVEPTNKLLECYSCHMLYHQKCHEPVVENEENFEFWKCESCKEFLRKLEAGAARSSFDATTSKSSPSPTKSPGGDDNEETDPKNEKQSKSTTRKRSSSASDSSSSPRSSPRPDKRMKIMKKKPTDEEIL